MIRKDPMDEIPYVGDFVMAYKTKEVKVLKWSLEKWHCGGCRQFLLYKTSNKSTGNIKCEKCLDINTLIDYT